MKAIVIDGQNAKFVTDRPQPRLRDDYILIKTHSVALNPTDWKHVKFGLGKTGALMGCDYSGTVQEVGRAVTKPFKKGDRIFGFTHGSNQNQLEDGAFAEWIMAKGDVQMHIPETMSYEEAATIGLGAFTCGQGLYEKALKLALPTHPVDSNLKEPVLIYGASTATGSLAIQFAQLSGYHVIVTCSLRQHDRMRAMGIEPFDYKDPECGHKIREFTQNRLRYAWDTISAPSSAKICSDALSTEPGTRYGALDPVSFPRKDVEVTSTLVYTSFGEVFEKAGMPFDQKMVSEDFTFAKQFAAIIEDLVNSGKLKPHSIRLREGGLEGIPEAFKEMESGAVSNEKWVYNV